jgi:3-deoxy-manno-octulosonate cytidylyltransferase (CMP-KDO synthetase)
MIGWVAEAARAARAVHWVVVATDDERIARAAEAEGVQVRMTRPDHVTGTDRVAEAAEGLGADIVLNLQGDEPMLRPESVDRLVDAFQDPEVSMATLGVRGVTEAERHDPLVVKVLVDDRGNALYFSRAPIPFRAGGAGAVPLTDDRVERECLKHVGVYGFRAQALARFVAEPRRGIEALEDLEQLRALRMGWKVRVREIETYPTCVDVPEDVAVVESILRREGVVG